MPQSPYAYVEWEGPAHNHLVPMGDGQFILLDTEEAAEELADAVARCNPDRHNGHGQTHSEQDVEDAYKGAIHQILTKDFAHEEMVRQTQIAHHKLWGGPVPSAVMMPDELDPTEWKMLLTGGDGMPAVHSLPRKVVSEIPTPDSSNSYKGPYGWEARPPAQAVGRQRIRRRVREARMREQS